VWWEAGGCHGWEAGKGGLRDLRRLWVSGESLAQRGQIPHLSIFGCRSRTGSIRAHLLEGSRSDGRGETALGVNRIEFGEVLLQPAHVSDACLRRVSNRVSCSASSQTCRMASLCISCPLHSGIISLRTPNSSFIFDRRLLSIKLCAVFLAILRPAAVVGAGVELLFRLADAEGPGAAVAAGAEAAV
jgi:hypothetical protein